MPSAKSSRIYAEHVPHDSSEAKSMSTPVPGRQKSIDRSRLRSLMSSEEQKFVAEHPKSAALYERAQRSLLGGVPMNWMKKWAGKFPVFVAEAHGAHFTDVDGHEYADLCLGEPGAMTGPSPPARAPWPHARPPPRRGGRGHRAPSSKGNYAHASHRRRAVGRRRTRAPLPPSVLAIHAYRP